MYVHLAVGPGALAGPDPWRQLVVPVLEAWPQSAHRQTGRHGGAANAPGNQAASVSAM